MSSEYFSPDYYSARDKFLNEAKNNGAVMQSFIHPHQKGPGGRDLHMDCATFGDQSSKSLLVVISGTHGPEGYCGSGVQTGLMHEGRITEWAKKTRIALIHAHNPYGFAWDTRFNEDNIDLNRNYLPSFTPPLPQNPAYAQLHKWAAPQALDDQTMSEVQSKLLEYAAKNGFPALQAALTSGQYQFPDGAYYGGLAPSWSRDTLTAIFDEITKGVENMVIVDMHTGLGPFGVGEILISAPTGSKESAFCEEIWGAEVHSTKVESVSADLYGTLDEFLANRYSAIKYAVMALEFGTIDPLSVFKATQIGSWLHCKGDKTAPYADKLRQFSRDAFYPQGDEWANKVWDRSLEVITKAVNHL
jgi:hypothetical protein